MVAVRRWLMRVLGLSALAGAGYAVWRSIERHTSNDDAVAWEPAPFPYPPQPRATASTPDAPTPSPVDAMWVEPDGGDCPPRYPVKVKLSSGIFHVPGGASYQRTNPDRCYRDPAAAESDGFRPAAR